LEKKIKNKNWGSHCMKNLMEVFGPQEGWKKSGNKQREQLAVVHHLLKFAVEFGILCPIFFGFCFDILYMIFT